MSSLIAVSTQTDLLQVMRTTLLVNLKSNYKEGHSEVSEINIVRVLVDPMKVHTKHHQDIHLRHQIPMRVIQTIFHHISHQVHMEDHMTGHSTAQMKDPKILIIQDHLIHHQTHLPTHHMTHHPIHQNNKEDMVDLEEVEEVFEDKEVRKDSEKHKITIKKENRIKNPNNIMDQRDQEDQ